MNEQDRLTVASESHTPRIQAKDLAHKGAFEQENGVCEGDC